MVHYEPILLKQIRGCVSQGRFAIHSSLRRLMTERGLVWGDVVAVTEQAALVPQSTLERFRCPQWTFSGTAPDGGKLKVVWVREVGDRWEPTFIVHHVTSNPRRSDRPHRSSTLGHRHSNAAPTDVRWPLTLRDGRTTVCTFPRKWLARGRCDSVLLLPPANAAIDRAQALAAPAPAAPSPSYLATLRRGLGLTADGFARSLNLEPFMIFEWELGRRAPSADDVSNLERIRCSYAASVKLDRAGRSTIPWLRGRSFS
jgi:DNA-binding transcriptional regulator YiaG